MTYRTLVVVGWGWLVASLTLVSCSGPTWPSQGLTVSTKETNPSTFDISKAARDFLLAREFRELGKNGRDQLRNEVTLITFEGPNELLVSVGVDRDTYVLIRVSQRSAFSPDAASIFDGLASELESRWPNAVIREAVPTK